MKNKAKEIVLSFIEALNLENFEIAKNLVANDLKFNGVMGARNSADDYFTDMKKMRLKYEVLQSYGDENGVAVFYDIAMEGKKIFTAGWYQLENDKIKTIQVVFDPRPLLENKSA